MGFETAMLGEFPQLSLDFRSQFLEGEEDAGGVGVFLIIERRRRKGSDDHLFEETALEDSEGVSALVDAEKGRTV